MLKNQVTNANIMWNSNPDYHNKLVIFINKKKVSYTTQFCGLLRSKVPEKLPRFNNIYPRWENHRKIQHIHFVVYFRSHNTHFIWFSFSYISQFVFFNNKFINDQIFAHNELKPERQKVHNNLHQRRSIQEKIQTPYNINTNKNTTQQKVPPTRIKTKPPNLKPTLKQAKLPTNHFKKFW